ncbi:DUF3500 domain-containing protein [Kineosporia sp. J2-2]|uniref:DUF3500 domain-containing protein n=1 Tax=Kineosporia corallincola TaxID=2835133 RepID=A0ABS5TGK6_9ACTN|nr:DUF3500 domain-containing protein [Kineosporia corallincola]MBT0770224.1 DUF3500 domain-containing protein [Kineosporia corallincola]
MIETTSSLPGRALSRRTLLAGVPALAAALSACSGSSSGATATTSTSTTEAVTAVADGEAAAGSVAALAQAFYNTLDSDLQTTVLQNYTLANAKRWSNLPQGLLGGGSGGMPSGGSSGMPSGASGMPSGSTGDASGMPSGMPSGGPGGSSGSSGAPSGGAGGGTGGGNSTRLGVNIGQLSDDQVTALNALLEAATGTKTGLGWDEIQMHLDADDYLGDNGGGDTYGRENFYLAILGSPQDSGTWELQFGGHHLAVANTYTDGVLVGATPAFRGIEPNGQFTWDGKTEKVLKVKEKAFTAVLAALSTAEQKSAKLADTYSDLVLGPGNDWTFPTDKEGIQVSKLPAATKKLVLAAIATYVDDIADDDAATILKKYESELDDTYLAFSGTTKLTEKDDYVRIDGPSVWIEYSMQNGIVLSGNHPHTVWRDRTTDYGGTQS